MGPLSQEATKGCASLIPNRKLKVTLLSNEWASTKGGLSTINRELAVQLAKNDNVEVSMYLPLCREEDERAAAGLGVRLLKAKKKPGYDPIDWLASIPRDHHVDVVIGHGIHLGRQVPMIKESHPDCKWIQVVHTDPEEFGMFQDDADSIVKGEKKHQAEVELCELADQVVAVGPKLTEAFACYLCVHPCLLTGTRIWTHTRTVGSVQLLGTFSSPQKKDPINRLFMASKPYIWGHFRGPHKLVKN